MFAGRCEEAIAVAQRPALSPEVPVVYKLRRSRPCFLDQVRADVAKADLE
jgi:hypothetical protein